MVKALQDLVQNFGQCGDKGIVILLLVMVVFGCHDNNIGENRVILFDLSNVKWI